MPGKKLSEHLTIRVFFLTFLILLFSGAVTFALIALAAPSTYTSVVNDKLQRQVDSLIRQLEASDLSDSGPLLDSFIQSNHAQVMVLAADGSAPDTGSLLALDEHDPEAAFLLSAVPAPGAGAFPSSERFQVSITSDRQSSAAGKQYAILRNFSFAGDKEVYRLFAAPVPQEENLAVQALLRTAPWLLFALLIFSFLCAFFYSRFITRPILRLSSIAGQMAQLDFSRKCVERRRDEIGALGHSLNQLSDRLSVSLAQLEEANESLRREVKKERELDQQRMAFFSAASHELKTPVTILKGQLSGMLEGIGVYQNRDQYLLRSLQTVGRMEHLIQEMLSITRMESRNICQNSLVLSSLIEAQLRLDGPLFEHKGQIVNICLEPGVLVRGDGPLLAKAVDNLLSNAAFYSPEGAQIRVWCGFHEGRPAFSVENTGVHLREESLPRLFEPFYREEGSRNSRTGGSGLGLYLVQMILQKHMASCTIVNTPDGVRAFVLFPADEESSRKNCGDPSLPA